VVTIKELRAFTFNMDIYMEQSHSWAKYASTHTVTCDFLIEHTKSKVDQCAKPALWIFDIDSTLLCLSARFQHIFYDFLRFKFSGAVPESYWKAAQLLTPCEHRYGMSAALEPALVRAGVEDARKVALDLERQMLEFWYEGFFSEKYLDKDFAYPNSAAFVSAIHQSGAHVCFLTGRHAKTMTQGTRATLKNLGFPLNHETAFLNLKVNLNESDVDYKHRYLSHLNRKYSVLGFMDNEPENIHAQIKINSDALPVWFYSISSDRIPSLSAAEEAHLCVLNSFNCE
jgi:hypothetical protein